MNALVSYLRRGLFYFAEGGMDEMMTQIARSIAIALHHQLQVEEIETLLEKTKILP